MRDLRLVGVHDDGGHLLLSGTGGEMFQLPIDEALRFAASRTPAQVAARASITPVAMSPRDIQSRIRSGATAAEVAELSGLPLANVQRYEGPVLAEREYIAQQARKVEVAAPAPGQDTYRAAFGDDPASLGEMVAHRLRAHGIDSSAVEWDSWRRSDGAWTVVARFETKPGSLESIGEEPPAMWTFHPARKTIQNANRWAQQLSELEPLDGPVPPRRLAAVSDRPFDFEADAGTAARAAAAAATKEADGLLDMLRSRRGQRLGLDEDSDDALALLLSSGVPAAHPRPGDTEDGPADQESADKESQDTDTDEQVEAESAPSRRDARASMLSRLSLAPKHDDKEDDSLHLHDGVSTDTREITVIPSPLRPVTLLRGRNDNDAQTGQDEAPTQGPASPRAGLDELLGGGPRREREEPKPTPSGQKDEESSDAAPAERQPSRPKRSSIPSWDDILFGTRGD
ncbi:septation protein SepH [Arthrobacter sp. B2a2-09]|uniref:septation protein SepH n=1 Tax=Arthrobacter sp. B2a2-09 TaxID=2952822 RepID=UPI0022CD8615|nr:septation protein SepH [Arthrobacter sp. B2a2-09]MCZ9881556.1 septation protein SepH [Arthrobacter sp. B2a2-09]